MSYTGSAVSRRQRMQQLQAIAEKASARSTDPTRHKCFVSYHTVDDDEVASFLDSFGEVFIPRSVGVTEEDDFINSDNEDYVKQRIRDLYLRDSTVTILLLGQCTWSRKFVDWEISATLRNDHRNKRSGLLALPLPSMNNSARLPDRVKDNWVEGDEAASYALYKSYPSYQSTLRGYIDAAFDARTAKALLANNARALRQRDSTCP